MNDINLWRETATELGLSVVTAPDGSEIAIFQASDPDRGYLWVSRGDLVKIEDGEDVIADVDYIEAYNVMIRLANRVKCQWCSEAIEPGGAHKHFGRLYR